MRRSTVIGAIISLLLLVNLTPHSIAEGETTTDGTACTIVGTSGDDVIDGTVESDVICGLGGNDVITGGGGNDTIDAGDGNDTIDAGDGNDTIDAGDGNDNSLGGNGNDEIALGEGDDTGKGGPGADKLWGGDGSDSLYLDAGNDWVDAGIGNDNVWLGSGNDYALGGPGADKLFGGDGSDSLNGGSGSDALNGGSGADTIDGGQNSGKDRDSCAADKIDKIRNCFFDSKGPSIISLAISPSSINTASSPRVLVTRIRVKDSGTGVQGVSLDFVNTQTGKDTTFAFALSTNDCAHLVEFSDGQAHSGCRISGNSYDGIYQLTTRVPQFTVPGVFQLAVASVGDCAGNTTVYREAALAQKHIAISFRQTGVGDGRAPILRSLALLANKVDTSQQPRVLALRATVTDPGAGIKEIYFQFDDHTTFGFWGDWSLCENGHAIDPAFPGSGTSCLVSGTKNSAVIEMKIMLPAYSPKKSYKLKWVTTADLAGNSSVTGDPVLAERGLAISFSQIGKGDNVGPVLKSVSVLTKAINTGIEAQQVRLRVRVLDNMSGVQGFAIEFQRISASGSQVGPGVEFYCSIQTCLVSGNDRDGTYEISAELPAHAAGGTYRFVNFFAIDRAQNHSSQDAVAIKKAKLYVSFINQ